MWHSNVPESLKVPILYNKVCDTLFRIIENVKVGNLDCLPNQAAAQMCYESLKVE